MKTECTQVQEQIAWGRPMDTSCQAHILTCAECEKLAHEFTRLDALLDTHLEIKVPDSFADQVMAQVLAGVNESKNAPYFERFFERAFAYLSIAIASVVAAVHFVFFVLGIPLSFAI